MAQTTPRTHTDHGSQDSDDCSDLVDNVDGVDDLDEADCLEGEKSPKPDTSPVSQEPSFNGDLAMPCRELDHGSGQGTMQASIQRNRKLMSWRSY